MKTLVFKGEDIGGTDIAEVWVPYDGAIGHRLLAGGMLATSIVATPDEERPTTRSNTGSLKEIERINHSSFKAEQLAN